jgi:hypothetical protein
MFYTFFSSTYQQLIETTKQTDFRNPASVGRLAVDYALLTVVPATLSALLLRALRPGDDDEDLREYLIKENLNYVLGVVPYVRELSGVVTGFQYRGPAGYRAFSDIGAFLTQVKQGEADEAFWSNLNKSAGALFHVPSTQIGRMARGIAAWADGLRDPRALLLGPPRN